MWVAVIQHVGLLLLVAALAGIVRRGRYRACWAFTTYLVAMLVSSLLMYWIWPSRFYTQQFWLQKEAVLNGLKLAIALELAVRTFRAFPGAHNMARGVLFLVLVITLATIGAAQGPELDFETLAGKLLPRIVTGTVWVFTAIAGLILWYRLPVDAFHKAILTGFVPYLLVFTTALQLFTSYGWDLSVSMINRYLYPLAYIVLLSYWTWSAWQPARAPVRPGRATTAGAEPRPVRVSF